MTPFSRTMRAVASDRYRLSGIGLVIGALLLVGWGLWMSQARVPVFTESLSARIETALAVHDVEAEVGGRVTTLSVSMGDFVRRGEVLLALDVSSERARLAEAEAQVTALQLEREPLAAAIDALRLSLEIGDKAAQAGVAHARALAEEADAAARHAAKEADRLASLRAAGAVAEAEQSDAESLALQRNAAAAAARRSIGRSKWEERLRQGDRRLQLAELERELTVLEGELVKSEATIARLQIDIEQSQVRASVDGWIGELADLQPGSVVSAGDHLASIVPSGALRVVAEFPAAAQGRVRAGQRGRLRLDAFPWVEYGEVEVLVERVATEPRSGRLRVELQLEDEQSFAGHVEHGLTGRVDVEVERVAPGTLVLRALGKLVDDESPPPASRAPVAPAEGSDP